MQTDYSAIDTQKIISFLQKRGGEVLVEDVIAHSGAEKLRVYPLIQRMYLAHQISILQRNSWGTPVLIKWEPSSK